MFHDFELHGLEHHEGKTNDIEVDPFGVYRSFSQPLKTSKYPRYVELISVKVPIKDGTCPLRPQFLRFRI